MKHSDEQKNIIFSPYKATIKKVFNRKNIILNKFSCADDILITYINDTENKIL